MSISNLQIIIFAREINQQFKSDSNVTLITIRILRKWVKQGVFLRHIFRYNQAQLLIDKIVAVPRPFIFSILLRLLSRGKCYIVDKEKERQEITTAFIFKLFKQVIRDLFQYKRLLKQIRQEVKDLSDEYAISSPAQKLDLLATPIYLRTDLIFGLLSGGSVGHTAGVLNNLFIFGKKPIFITTDFIPMVQTDIETQQILPEQRFWDFLHLPSLAFNKTFHRDTLNYLKDKKLSFVYQRYSYNNYAGLKIARSYNIPFVLEYNGSEIWVSRNWGSKLKYETLSEQIELLNLNAADLIVAVSQPIKDELIERNIEPDKILVNPNGVDPDRYSPAIDGSQIRQKYGWQDKIILGFIGTFGPWHGAEILAEAFGRLWQEFPTFRQKVRLLMIGDGITMPLVKQNLSKYGLDSDTYALTGLVPQEQGAEYLAACDILFSPHVPNSDGTPFFGSPTKLFEYMAMGKGIVASDLDQIGEILEHKRTAWLVKPADVQSLLEGMKTVIEDEPLRHRLGEAARREVVAKYSWQEHVKKSIEKLKERCG